MSVARDRLEAGFSAWGRLAARWRWPLIGLGLAALLLAATHIGRIELDMSVESYLPEHDEARIAYDAFREQFGTDQTLIVLIRPPEIWDLAWLEELRALHEDLEASLPYVDEVRSLVNARRVYGTDDEFIVEDLFERWPEDAAELDAIRRVAEDTPAYQNIYLTEDGRYTSIVIETDASTGPVNDRGELFERTALGPLPEAGERGTRDLLTSGQVGILVPAARAVLDRHADPDTALYLSGEPVFNYEFSTRLPRDMGIFTAISIALIAVLLLVLFRRWAGVVLPLGITVASLVTTLALMPVIGVPFTTITQILPSFLLVVGIGGSVHILAIYFRSIDAGEERVTAIAHAMGHSGLAVLMTSVTTAASLASFVTADILPIAQLGIAAPLGVMVGLVLTIALLPALLAVIPVRRRAEGAVPVEGTIPRGALDRALLRMGDFASHRPWAVVIGTALIWSVAFFGMSKLRFAHDALGWFPEGDPFTEAAHTINDVLHSSFSLEVLVDTGEQEGLKDPELLEALDATARYASDLELGGLRTGKVVSLVDVVKETHRALNASDPAAYAIPDDPMLLSQELLLFESSGADELERFTDTSFRVGRMTLTIPSLDAFLYPPFIDAVTHDLEERIGDRAEVRGTGTLAIIAQTFRAVVSSMVTAYAVAFVAITVLMMLVMGGVVPGLVSMIPNLSPVLITLGLMGFMGIDLNVSTILLGSIAIGIAVDDTIHFMHNFRRYREQTGDGHRAVQLTLLSTGRAMLFTSIALGAGFLVYIIGEMGNIREFGMLNALTIGLAFFADVILAPALVVLLYRKGVPAAKA